MDLIFGTPSIPKADQRMGPMNRNAKRSHLGKQLKIRAEPVRRKYEKRGAEGRATKGRKPHART